MEAEIKRAAKWWADQVRYGAIQYNGDTYQSMLLSVLADKRKKPSNGQIDTFESVLAEEITKEPPFGGTHTIMKDYYSTDVLKEACTKAGIDDAFLPIKTVMWIKSGSVLVRNGYGASTTEIFNCSELNED